MNLVPRFFLGDLDLTDYPFAVEFGAQYGSPENVTEVLNSLLADGELLSSTRTSNREMTLTVIVEGSDMLALAEAEATLVREASKPANTLTIDPGDGFAPPTAFDTFRAGIDFDRNDAHEGQNLRRFVLTIPALPYGRSESLTTEVAEGIPSVGTIVNAGTSLTGWSTPAAVVPGSSSGSYVPADPQPANMLALDGGVAAKAWRVVDGAYLFGFGQSRRVDNRLELAQAIAAQTGAYLSFEVWVESSLGREVTNTYFNQTYRDGGVLDSFAITAAEGERVYKNAQTRHGERLLSQAIVQALPDGYVRYTVRLDEALTVSRLTFDAYQYVPWTDDPNATQRARIKVRNVAVAQTATLGKQALKTINVGGSARAPGSLHVAAPADNVALGKVLAYTVPSPLVAAGYRPDLRQWTLPGAATDTVGGRSALTGIGASYNAPGSPVMQVTASMLRAGSYLLAGSLYSGSGNVDMVVEAALLIGGAVVAVEETPIRASMAAGTWELRTFDTIYLPPSMIQTPTSDATVRFRFKGAATALLEELYVFPVEGRLSVIDCGSGTVGPSASSHLWIDSPSPEQPEGGYWRGATPTRQNAVSAWSTTIVPGVHVFEPGQMFTFAASSDAQGPTVSFDYFKRWMAHAPE